MDEDQNRMSFITELMQRFAAVFTMVILTMTLSGKLISRMYPDAQNTSALFAFGPGLSYSIILQISALALILAFCVVLVFSEHPNIKIRSLVRYILLMLATLLFTAIFSVVFNWIPASDPFAWLLAAITAIICFSISIGLSFLWVKLQGKKYNELLAKYKERQRG